MGIPYLAKLLQPYAVPAVFYHSLLPTEGAVEQRRAVIDGPALAHHAYYIASSRRVLNEQRRDALPSYNEVCIIVIDWLGMLSLHGVTVAAIYFDGKLPHAKRQIRLARLEQYLRQLTTFRTLSPSGLSLSSEMLEEEPHGSLLFSARPMPRHLKLVPPAPFIVPVVIDALLSSVYADSTHMIPGEADVFCARDVRVDGGFVITSDSDLLVHNLGSKGGVAFFSDFSLEQHLTAKLYTPASIAERMKLSSISQLAFAVSRNKGKSLNECIALAKTIRDADEAFVAFVTEYNDDRPSLVDSLDSLSLTGTGSVTPMLDPRVSEYILQGSSTEPIMYLPFLFDDPTRFSAWTCGADIRRLSFSIVQPDCQRTSSMLSEVQRRGNGRIGEVFVRMLTQSELSLSATKLINDVEGWRTQLVDASVIVLWRSLAISIMTKDLQALEKPLPSEQNVRELLAMKSKKHSWHDVHLRACFHAVCYSLRILNQFLKTYKHSDGPLNAGNVDREAVRALQTTFNGLPDIVPLFEGNVLGEDTERYAYMVCGRAGLSAKTKRQESNDTEHKVTQKQSTKNKSVTEPSIGSNRFAALRGLD